MTEILDRLQLCLNGHKFTIREAKLEGTSKKPELHCPVCGTRDFTELASYVAPKITEDEG